MIRSIVTAAAATIMAGATMPALANESAPKMTYDTKSHQFCTAPTTITGSNIAIPECHSAANWAKLGLTVQLRTAVAQR